MLGENECYICKYYYGWSNQRYLHEHHIFAGGTSGRRNTSDKYGLTVMLCPQHHQIVNEAVHNAPNTGCDLILKQMAQRYYEENIGTRDDFIRDFIKSYL